MLLLGLSEYQKCFFVNITDHFAAHNSSYDENKDQTTTYIHGQFLTLAAFLFLSLLYICHGQ